MKKYNSGEIYFIREIDYHTSQKTPYVKIGLVRYSDKRDSWGRLYEHQTANPRKLDLNPAHILSTQAVDLVEARLHKAFAQDRISGEWFEFKSDSALEEAVKKAKALVQDVDAFLPKLQEADELKWKASNKVMLSTTDEYSELAQQLVVAKRQIEICKELEAKIGQLLVTAKSEGRDVSKYSEVKVKPFVPSFRDEDFQSEHPDLWDKYQAMEKSWYQRFSPKLKLDSDAELGQEFNETNQKLSEIIESVSSSKNLWLLVDPTLELTNLRGLADWSQTVSQTSLKLAIGEHEGIEGLCTWTRKETTPMKFDSKTFEAENPELYREFLTTGSSKEILKPKKTKS
jgi:hypothetical protein